MKKYWIQIKIGKKKISPVLIYDGIKACQTNTMPALSCTLIIPRRLSIVPIEFSYLEGEGDESNGKSCFTESINMPRETGFVNILGTILGGNSDQQVKIDIFFNENDERLCIGFLANRFQPVKYIVKGEYWKVNKDETSQPPVSIIGKPAKDVFVNNFLEFGKLLPITAAHADLLIVDKWRDTIKSIEDSDMLLVEFNKYVDNLDTWLKLLCSWGLKQDGCKQYPGMLINTDNYITENNVLIEQELSYKVIVPCWTIWIEENGKRTERLVSKGIIKAV